MGQMFDSRLQTLSPNPVTATGDAAAPESSVAGSTGAEGAAEQRAATQPTQAKMRTVDGADTVAAAAPVAQILATDTTQAATPTLPQASTPTASVSATRSFLDALQNTNDYTAFAIIQQGQMKSLQLAGKNRVASQQGVFNASLAAIKDTVRQIAGQRTAAVVNLLGSIGGAATSAGAGVVGSSLRLGTTGKQSVGAALDGAAQQLGGLTSQFVQMVDKTAGGQYQADQASIQLKIDDMQKSIAQQSVDTFKASYDQASQQLQSAFQAFSDYFKRKESLMSNIANQ